MQYGLDPNNPDTGNTGIPDGYKNLAGDGWNNLYKYEHGMNPGQFYTPPPPRNVQARLDSTGTNVILTWESGGGPVSKYGIIAANALFPPAEIGQVSASVFSFTDHVEPLLMSEPGAVPGYQIRAYFSNGSHADSGLARFTKSELDIEAQIVRGPGGGYTLARDLQKVSIADIITAVDEPLDATQCGGKENCHDEQRCMTHDLWAKLNDKMYEYLDSVKLSDLVAQQAARKESVSVLQDKRGKEAAVSA